MFHSISYKNAVLRVSINLILIHTFIIPSLVFSDDMLSKEEHEAIKTLLDGGQVTNLSVDANYISYIREVCVTAGRKPEFDRRFTTCRDVEFSLTRKNLTVRSYGRDGLLTGEPVVRLEGEIIRNLTFSWDEYSITVRNDLERNFHRREGGNRTKFPVTNSEDLSKIASALRKLSK